MSQVNTITLPELEGTQLPISDSLTSPDSGVCASSKAAYDLNNIITSTVDDIKENIKDIQNNITTNVSADIEEIRSSISNVNNTTDANKNVASAAKLTSVRTIGGVDFDGTKNIDLPGVNIPGNQSISGNAATATKLATARTIGSVLFDGSANISLPGVNIPGNQNTTGNAATSNAWATARTLTLTGGVSGSVSIDGNADMMLIIENSYIGTVNAAAPTTTTSSGAGNIGAQTYSLIVSGNTARINAHTTLRNCNCQCSDSGA